MGSMTAAPRIDKERRVKSLIAFAADISNNIPTRTVDLANVPTTIIDKLEESIRNFPNNLSAAASKHYGELDAAGTSLYNACTRLKRGVDSGTALGSNSLTIMMIRVYALLLLDCAQNSGKGTAENAVRLMTVSLKTAKSCLALKQYDFALKSLEKSGAYEVYITNKDSWKIPEDADNYWGLSAQYYVLRTALAWRQDQLQLAEHMYKKAVAEPRRLDARSSEDMADVLYEIGKEQLTSCQYVLAVQWLSRAHDLLLRHDLELLSADASELRTSITQSSVRALLGVQDADATDQARNLVEALEGEVGDRMVTLLLRLELLEAATNEVFDSQAYAVVLRRMIKTVALNDSIFKTIIQHIRKLNDKSPSLACGLLDELLTGNVLEEEKREWLEIVLVNRLWMATSQKDGLDVTFSVEEMLNKLLANLSSSIGAAAIHASQTLLWRRIEANYSLGQYDIAGMWCRLAMHQVFNDSGDLNKGKIARKLLLCALAKLDSTSAQEIYESMAESTKQDPLTQFLMFKVAIRAQDVELAQMSLGNVSEAVDQDPSLLYACVVDAQKAGDRRLTLVALQHVLLKYEYNAPPNVHMPALLRSMIRMTILQLDSGGVKQEAVVAEGIEQLCKLFEGGRHALSMISQMLIFVASNGAKKAHLSVNKANTLCEMKELDWFSKNSYNLALKNCVDWPPQQVCRLLQSCLKFVGLYPDDMDQQTINDLALRGIFCHYLSAILLISLARTEDNIEVQLQNYLEVRKHVVSYDVNLEKIVGGLELGPTEDLKRKLCCLYAMDFEAAVRLKAWDALQAIILNADKCRDAKLFGIIADCLLSGDVPENVLIPRLKNVVNGVWSLDEFDMPKLSRYMRVLFQYSLAQTNSTQNSVVSEELLDSIAKYAADSAESETPYPPEEIEWVVTTAFNCAVDFYCAGEDEKCRHWAEIAINTAGCCPDDGALQDLLQEKYVGLNWDTN